MGKMKIIARQINRMEKNNSIVFIKWSEKIGEKRKIKNWKWRSEKKNGNNLWIDIKINEKIKGLGA